MSNVFVHTWLKVKTVQFQTVQFSISKVSIWKTVLFQTIQFCKYTQFTCQKSSISSNSVITVLSTFFLSFLSWKHRYIYIYIYIYITVLSSLSFSLSFSLSLYIYIYMRVCASHVVLVGPTKFILLISFFDMVPHIVASALTNMSVLSSLYLCLYLCLCLSLSLSLYIYIYIYIYLKELIYFFYLMTNSFMSPKKQTRPDCDR